MLQVCLICVLLVGLFVLFGGTSVGFWGAPVGYGGGGAGFILILIIVLLR